MPKLPSCVVYINDEGGNQRRQKLFDYTTAMLTDGDALSCNSLPSAMDGAFFEARVMTSKHNVKTKRALVKEKEDKTKCLYVVYG